MTPNHIITRNRNVKHANRFRKEKREIQIEKGWIVSQQDFETMLPYVGEVTRVYKYKAIVTTRSGRTFEITGNQKFWKQVSYQDFEKQIKESSYDTFID